MVPDPADNLARERDHHDRLYSGFAQAHFAKPAVAAFRRHYARRFARRVRPPAGARILSAGCGIGDFELLLAPLAAEILGIDLSPLAIEEARAAAARQGVRNVRFECTGYASAALPAGAFDVVLAKFFLHHLGPAALEDFALRARVWLKPGGCLYALDPSRFRLTGALGRLLIPARMARFQTEDEAPVDARRLRRVFEQAGFQAETRMYDFVSTPLAGLFPSWRSGYHLARAADEILVRLPGLSFFGSNVELLARAPGA